jgi:hypothetical protein
MAQTVEGSVVDAATGAGVGGVKVELLKDGDYADRYQSADHWLTAGWADYHVFHVAGGSPVHLETRLMPWSRISGRVVDNQGNGVANAPLELTGRGMTINGRTYLRTSWGGGGGGQFSQPLAMSFRGQTDAHGKFEVQLMPGRVWTFRGSAAQPEAARAGRGRRYAGLETNLLSGVDSAEAASKIVVFPGSEVSGVELKLLAIPAHAVRGLALYPDGSPAAKAQIAFGEAPRSARLFRGPMALSIFRR